jgi:hypothetical protein
MMEVNGRRCCLFKLEAKTQRKRNGWIRQEINALCSRLGANETGNDDSTTFGRSRGESLREPRMDRIGCTLRNAQVILDEVVQEEKRRMMTGDRSAEDAPTRMVSTPLLHRLLPNLLNVWK